MSIESICSRQVDQVEPDETAQAAGQRMNTRSVGTLIVVDSEERPIGILTDRDLALRVVGEGRDPAATRVKDVMTPKPRTVTEKTPIEDALSRMRSLGVRRLPVVGSRGEIVGIVSLDDILVLLTQELREVGRLLDSTSPRSLLKL